MDRQVDAEALLGELSNLPPELQLASVEEKSEFLGLPAPGPATKDRRNAITKTRYSHDACVEMILQNPWIHQNQLALIFGVTAGWMSTVMQTDAFQAKLAQRREELVDPVLRATLKERFQAVVAKSLEVLQEKLSKPNVNDIPDNLALRAAEMGAKSLGFGLPAAPAAPPAVSPSHLSELAERLVQLQGTARKRHDSEDARIVAEE